MRTLKRIIFDISLMIVALVSCSGLAVAAGPGHIAGSGWDASTRVINSSLTDGDIQKVLEQSLPPQFSQVFPARNYGLFVLVDKSQSKELNQQVVYILISLCNRRHDGSYELPLATYSIAIPFNAHGSDQERLLIAERLMREVASFAQVLLQNSNSIHGAQLPAAVPGHAAQNNQPHLPHRAPKPKPFGWNGDNVFLGSWYSESKAGAAVLDRVTITPERISWGNKANGKCDSEYDVQWIPADDGTYPDNQSLPEPGVSYSVARLTLVPGPCATGDAMIQLAYPSGGERSMHVVLYGRDGNTTGWFGKLMPLPD